MFVYWSKCFWQALASLSPLGGDTGAWMFVWSYGAGSIQPCFHYLPSRLDKARGCAVPVASSRLCLGETWPRCWGNPEIQTLWLITDFCPKLLQRVNLLSSNETCLLVLGWSGMMLQPLRSWETVHSVLEMHALIKSGMYRIKSKRNGS